MLQFLNSFGHLTGDVGRCVCELFFSGERIVLEIEIWKLLVSPCPISGVTGDEEKPCRVGVGKWPGKAFKEC